jgi:hypothetical protein
LSQADLILKGCQIGLQVVDIAHDLSKVGSKAPVLAHLQFGFDLLSFCWQLQSPPFVVKRGSRRLKFRFPVGENASRTARFPPKTAGLL